MRSRALRAFATSLSLLAGIHGCVGTDPVATSPESDGGGGVDASAEGSLPDGSPQCTPGCVTATTLRTCAGPDETCALGCAAGPTPHCMVLEPSAPVTAADLKATGVDDVTLGAATFISTNTGSIDGVRAANANPETYEVVGGIGFKLFKGLNVGVFTGKSFSINDTISVGVVGSAAIAIVVSTKITIRGELDARARDANKILCDSVSISANTAIAPGGRSGVYGAAVNGAGAGAGRGGDIGGGGGGGFGGGGGNGGIVDGFSGASLGGSSVAFPATISGGFAGGSNGAGGSGAGGGGVHLVAGEEIVIGGGTDTGGVNAGGCGGVGGQSPFLPDHGGGGGGSGGEILLQAPRITFAMGGVLAANGGAGGAGAGRGVAGQLSNQAAPAQVTAATAGQGGAGSAGATLEGGGGLVCSVSPSSCFAGGGGGGAGWIRIETASGAAPVLAAGAFVSPSLGTSAATTAKVAAK